MTRRKPGEWWGHANADTAAGPTNDEEEAATSDEHPCPRCDRAMTQWVYDHELIDYFSCANTACKPSLREQLADELKEAFRVFREEHYMLWIGVTIVWGGMGALLLTQPLQGAWAYLSAFLFFAVTLGALIANLTTMREQEQEPELSPEMIMLRDLQHERDVAGAQGRDADRDELEEQRAALEAELLDRSLGRPLRRLRLRQAVDLGPTGLQRYDDSYRKRHGAASRKVELVKKKPIDVSVEDDGGNVIIFTLNTAAARDWAEANVDPDGYQAQAVALGVEMKYVTVLSEGMIGDGLNLELL